MPSILGCIKRAKNWEYTKISSEYDLQDFLDIVSVEKPKNWLITDNDNTRILTVNQAKHELRRGAINAQ